MLHLHLLAAQPAHELHIVIAGDAKCRSGRGHITDDANRIQHMGSAVRQVAKEDRSPPGRVPPALVAPRGSLALQCEPLPSGLSQQRSEFIRAAVQVAEEVEWTRLILLVVPKRDTPDLDLFRFIEDMDVPKTLALQPAEAPFEFRDLAANHVRSEIAVRPPA